MWLVFPNRRLQWHTWSSQNKLKQCLIEYLFGKKTTNSEYRPITNDLELFYNARSALYHGIQALGIWTDDEIILQAYTCVSVANSIIATGATPLYVDIDLESLNIDPTKIEESITPHTKAILIQHTFGIPANIKAIQKICSDYKLVLIEDCCHALGAEYNWRKLGTFWDIAIFSFGRDKIISSVNGWALLINNSKVLENQKTKTKKNIIHQSSWVIVQNLLYIIVWQICKITYKIGIGKFIYYVSAKYRLFPIIVTKKEKECCYTDFNYVLPNCLADIALHELDKIDEYNVIRRKNSELYDQLLFSLDNKSKNSGLLRYLYLIPHPLPLMQKFKSHNIILWDRYQQVIAPKWTNYSMAFYTIWSCPIAEFVASQSINLPNHAQITEKDVRKIVSIL